MLLLNYFEGCFEFVQQNLANLFTVCLSLEPLVKGTKEVRGQALDELVQSPVAAVTCLLGFVRHEASLEYPCHCVEVFALFQ